MFLFSIPLAVIQWPCVPRWLAAEPQLQCLAMPCNGMIFTPWIHGFENLVMRENWIKLDHNYHNCLDFVVPCFGQSPDLQMSASTITGAGGSFECPHLCQLSESLGVEMAGIAKNRWDRWDCCRGVKVGSTWPQQWPGNGQLLPGMQQPCSLAKEISDRFDALRPLLGQGHCHSVRGFKSGQVSL